MLEFQDKVGEGIDKVKKNIYDCVASNKTAIEIRAKDVPIRRGRGARKSD